MSATTWLETMMLACWTEVSLTNWENLEWDWKRDSLVCSSCRFSGQSCQTVEGLDHCIGTGLLS